MSGVNKHIYVTREQKKKKEKKICFYLKQKCFLSLFSLVFFFL